MSLLVAGSRLASLGGGERRHVMKAIRVEKQGGPEVLKLLDIAPIEAPGPGQAVALTHRFPTSIR